MEPEAIDLEGMVLRHICEVCDREELLTPAQAFDAGWDYPPRLGAIGIVSPRTCGNCGIESTLWWAVAMENKAGDELTDRHYAALARIQSEPESIFPDSESEDTP